MKLLLLSLACFFAFSLTSYCETRLIVKYKNNFSKFKKINTYNVKITQPFKLLKNFAVIELNNNKSTEKLIKELRINQEIEYVEKVQKWEIDSIRIPNDPKFERQWNLYNVGQTFGKKDADIDAPEAWNNLIVHHEVLVAVIDSGLDYHHEDILDNIWQNQAELNGKENVDDDNNGFVDDYLGWDFVNNDNDPYDDRGHGTHISGIIAAEQNNALGISGIAPNTKILPIKVMDNTGNGDTDNIIKGIEYAIMNGANIINNSYGSKNYSRAVEDVIKIANEKNILFVASAGNSSSDNDLTDHFPSGYDVENIISVAASNERDEIPKFSNFGKNSVHLAAPGTIIPSLLPGNKYTIESGTSQAAPHVSGVAALLLGHNNTLLVSELKAAILNGVDKKENMNNLTISGGRLNALNSLGLIQ